MSSKADISPLNLLHGTNNKKWKKRKTKKVKMDKLRSIGKHSGNPWSQS